MAFYRCCEFLTINVSQEWGQASRPNQERPVSHWSIARCVSCVCFRIGGERTQGQSRWGPRDPSCPKKTSAFWRRTLTSSETKSSSGLRGSWWELRVHLWQCSWHVHVLSDLWVPAGSPSRGGDVIVYVWHKPTELAHSFLFCSWVYFYFMALSTVFHSMNSPDNSPLFQCSFDHISALLVLSSINHICLWKSPSALI